jgi:methionyl-tRNA formyltransferase
MISAYKGNLELSKCLIKMGADPNATNRNGTTVLMYAKEACERTVNFELCDYLLAAGADPLAMDHFGKTVIDYALTNKQINACAYFKRLI